MIDPDDTKLAKAMRRAMADYKATALAFKAEGNEEKFKQYRNSWCVLEALLPVDPSEYW